MIISENELRTIIRKEILEQFTIPKHSKHSSFELYTEGDEPVSSEARLKKTGAGFLIARVFPKDKVRFLGLIAPKKIRDKKGGTYDIPKGKLKEEESEIDGATRECKEESGILVKNSDIIGDPVKYNNLTIFLASCNQDPEILPNPDSGVVEHEGFKWLSRDELVDSCLNYLKPVVKPLADRFINSLDKN